MGDENRGGAGGPAHFGSTESCNATFPVSQVQGGHASTGLGDGRNIQQGGGGSGHAPTFAKVVDEFGREIKYKTAQEAKAEDARYVADLIVMLRWLSEAWDKNRTYGTPTPPAYVIDFVNDQVVKELEAFHRRYKK